MLFRSSAACTVPCHSPWLFRWCHPIGTPTERDANVLCSSKEQRDMSPAPYNLQYGYRLPAAYTGCLASLPFRCPTLDVVARAVPMVAIGVSSSIVTEAFPGDEATDRSIYGPRSKAESPRSPVRVSRYLGQMPRVHLNLGNTLAHEMTDRKSTRLNSSHSGESRMPSSA